MNPWREAALRDEIELAYGKALPAHVRQPGQFGVFGSNGRVGTHTEALVEGPGIVVGRKGTVGAVAYSAESFWPIDTTYFVVNKRDHNWRYLYYLLLSSGLTGLNSHSAVPGLNREDVYSIAVTIPPRDEQDSIACVLDRVEDAIRLETDLLTHARTVMDVTMRELFTHGLRGGPVKDSLIGPLPESWDVVEFGSVRDSLQYGTSTRCSHEATEFPVLRIPNIEPGKVNVEDLKYGNLTAQEAARYQLRDGDLLFIRTNGVIERLGTCAVYAGRPQGALFASYLIRARLQRNRLDPHYAAYFFASAVGTTAIASRATPAADGKYNLNTGTIDSLPIPLPPTLSEQMSIVEVLQAVDHKISLHRQKCAVLESIFNCLLDRIVTGELRVHDLDVTMLADASALGESAA